MTFLSVRDRRASYSGSGGGLGSRREETLPFSGSAFTRGDGGPRAAARNASAADGLRANGVELLQFIVGGLQGELSFTSLFNGAEIVFPTLFPGGTTETTEPSERLHSYSAIPSTGRPYAPGSISSLGFGNRSVVAITGDGINHFG